MIYVLKLVGEVGVENILNISDENGVIKYLNDINELGVYTISNMKHYLSRYGIFFFKQGYCIVDINSEKLKLDLFSKNYMIYNNLIAFIRDEKLKNLMYD
jgi:hypothetical protein